MLGFFLVADWLVCKENQSQTGNEAFCFLIGSSQSAESLRITWLPREEEGAG